MAEEPPKRILEHLGLLGNFYARLEHVKVDFGKGIVQETYRAVIPDGAHVLAFTDEGKVLLVHHFRVFGQGWSYELPGGIINKDELESPEETALRELEEETGYKAHEIERLISYHPIPTVRCESELFLARKLEKGVPKRDETEHEMSVVEVTPSQLWAMVLDGTITDSQTIIATLVAKDRGFLKVDTKEVEKGHPF